MIVNCTHNDVAGKINIQGALVNAIFATMVFAGILFLHYYRPWLYMGLVLEDFWGEYATFVSYMLAFTMFSWATVKNKDMRKPGYLLIPLTMLLIAMDEISWGQRILNIETPHAITNLNEQSEITIHNSIVNAAAIEQLFFIAVSIWVFLLPIALRFVAPLNTLMAGWGNSACRR